MVTGPDSRNFEFIPVFRAVNNSVIQEVKALWKKNNILSEGEIMEERVKEIAMIARHVSGNVAGLTTVRKMQARLFNNNYIYEIRCFVDPSFRQPAMDTKLIVKTKSYLQEINPKESLPAIGLIMVIENEILKRWSKAVWAGADFYFAGFTSEGHHLRVSYFDDVFI